MPQHEIARVPVILTLAETRCTKVMHATTIQQSAYDVYSGVCEQLLTQKYCIFISPMNRRVGFVFMLISMHHNGDHVRTSYCVNRPLSS